MMDKSELFYSKTLSDICNGYSEITFDKKTLFYKHPNIFDKSLLEKKYFFFLERGKFAEKKTNEEITKEIKEQNLWGQKEEKQIKRQRDYLDGLNKNLSSAKNQEEESIIKKNIKQTEKEIQEILNKKEKFYKNSLENYVDSKLREYEPFFFSYKDKNLTTHFFESEDEFNELNTNEILVLNFSIYSKIKDFSGDNIERLILSDFFYPIFATYTKDTIPFYFSSKPQYRSVFQNIFTYYWQIYNQIVTPDIPNDIRKDPQKIAEYIKNKNKKQQKQYRQKEEIQTSSIKDIDFSKVKNANDMT